MFRASYLSLVYLSPGVKSGGSVGKTGISTKGSGGAIRMIRNSSGRVVATGNVLLATFLYFHTSAPPAPLTSLPSLSSASTTSQGNTSTTSSPSSSEPHSPALPRPPPPSFTSPPTPLPPPLIPDFAPCTSETWTFTSPPSILTSTTKEGHVSSSSALSTVRKNSRGSSKSPRRFTDSSTTENPASAV